MTNDYFDDLMINRQRLLWAIATRQQLERWEPYVAAAVRDDGLSDSDIWAAEIEHHLALVAARHLIQALELAPTGVSIDPTVRDELVEGRDLHEHWLDNLPVFLKTPRMAQPQFPSGKRYAARNPDRDPYRWDSWGNMTGPMLLPHVPASELHALVDAVEAEVLAQDEALERFVPERKASPWRFENGEWWPNVAVLDELIVSRR
jgi:hypothetical protein